MAQQALRREDDERERIFLEERGLPAEQVEVLRGGRAVRDAHVDVCGQLQEPLGARAGVIGPLAFVAVRQQQDERGLLSPLGARRQHELVENQLRAVDEVAVLRLPDHEPLGRLHVVAVLEADRGRFAERAVADLERRVRARPSAWSGVNDRPSVAS